MNQNDIDRYFWRTGQQWSAAPRPFKMRPAGWWLANRTILLLAAAFAVTIAMLFLQR